MKLTRYLLMFCLTLTTTVFAQTNFTGNWAFDESKSTLPESSGQGRGGRGMIAIKIDVVQNNNDITIKRTSTGRDGQEFTSEEKLTLDGKLCKNTLRNREVESTATWSTDKKTLTIKSSSTFQGNQGSMTIKTTEIFTLIEGGKALQIESTSESPRGERKAKLVYTKAIK